MYNTLHINILIPVTNFGRGSQCRSQSSERGNVSAIKAHSLCASPGTETYGIWGLLASGVIYIWYAIIRDYRARIVCDRDTHTHIEPQAEELQVGLGSDNTKSQNVSFNDTHPGYKTDILGAFDEVRSAPLASDATLDEFFSRPLRIASYDWGVGTTLSEVFNPWNLYFSNPRVINRIANYKLLQAKLHVKVLINGNSFHYGRLLVSYYPLPTLDEMSVTRSFYDVDNVGDTQRPHIMLDPTNSQGGEMVLPFFWNKNLLDIPGEDWSLMGALKISTLQGLKHALGATDTVTINVFAWAESVRFAIPTQTEPSAIAPQADEYGRGAISRPATVVANIASKLANVPIIGPFAKATQIGATATGAIAALFGYSKPAEIDSHSVRIVNRSSLATTVGTEQVDKLTVDPKQELTIDPCTVGLESTDEMAVLNIAQHETYLASFDWDVGTSQETLLWNCVVDPCLHRILNSELHFTAPCFATLPFDYWRGTMIFRFQVVCSKYHKGRLKIVYDPNQTPTGGAAEYNTAYTTIVDISDTTDFTIKAGWGQPFSYREHITIPTTESAMFSTTPLPYASNSVKYGNGTLAVYVVNELTVPNTAIDNDIEVNVFVSVDDDFEIAQPTSATVSKLRMNAHPNVAPQAFEPQASEAPADELNKMDSKPIDPNLLSQAALTIPTSDKTNMIHFGESIRSFRTLLKRFNLHEVQPALFDSGTVGQNIMRGTSRQALPFEPGYSTTSGSLTYNLTAGNYAYAQMTLMRYLTTGFAGWRGGVRWLYDFSNLTDVPFSAFYQVTRLGHNSLNANGQVVVSQTDTPAGHASCTEVYQNHNAQEGSSMMTNAVNNVLGFEVPYYSNYRFAPAKQKVKFDSTEMQAMPYYHTICQTQFSTASGVVRTYCAAAEDFNVFFYLGPPIFYYENTVPSA
ncbi:hypothetical protein 2 [Beihai picorna-like virus 17]|uniref:hypothetical protein 2 n=1 Tax=Beihai picorna-like virus 17 TaxID=1922559 RepID=UPI00090C99E3|nr:hypothetical protein 2 [Beihai picorna-like virus 17]APG78930.1 hypothetical protein 2 [Beihai picorna-like virus 17]